MPIGAFVIFIIVGLYLYIRSFYEDWTDAPIKSRNKLRDEIFRLKNLYGVSGIAANEVKNFLRSKEGIEAVCKEYEYDFRYIFGDNWRELLVFPPITDDALRVWNHFAGGGRTPMPHKSVVKKYNSGEYSFSDPNNDIYWVYRLILADRGKVDGSMLDSTTMSDYSVNCGYVLCSGSRREVSIRFAQRIASRLKRVHPEAELVLYDEKELIQFKTLVPWTYRKDIR